MSRIALIMAVCVLVTPAFASSKDLAGAATRAFVVDMLEGIGAVRKECDAAIRQHVEAREMQAICASFDGTFGWFEARWDLKMLQAQKPPRPDHFPAPRAEAETEWESSGAFHERIYRVGHRALGVRFAAGDLVMVW